MIKCLQIILKLTKAIRSEQWLEANDLVDELNAVLKTYKNAC